ncbi:MAG TPA: CoA pyrophosphatase [Azospirillaceae bacterium]|nr:CoA pyrophosphatase [Azospirillaceae bacterium]
MTPTVTGEDVRACFSRLAGRPPRLLARRGDDDLNPGLGRPAVLTPAAVLVPIVTRPDGATILFTQRTAHLSSHAGQISFPGGRIETDDRDAEAAALRETDEEIGLAPPRVDVVGRLDTYATRTGYEITPVVGLIRPPFILKPDPNEVAEVFEVPLDFVLDPANCERHTREFKGAQRSYYAFVYGDRYIWGATAGMLVNLRDVLRGGT